MAKVGYSEERMRARDGTEIFYRSWNPETIEISENSKNPGTLEISETPETPRAEGETAGPRAAQAVRAVIVIAHGLADHSGRYTHVAEYFANLGYAVYAYDHRGQGKSGGVRGHVDSFSQFYDDLAFVIDTVKSRHPGKKLFLIGHSMGGLIVLGYAARRPGTVDGIVASSPCLDLKMKVPPVKKALGVAVSYVAPRLSMDTGIPAENLSHDAKVVSDYVADQIRYPKITARFYVEFDRAMSDVRRAAATFAVPCLFMPGGDDPVCSTDATREFYARDPHPDKKLVVWDGLYHEIFNEPQKDQVLATAADWIAERERR